MLHLVGVSHGFGPLTAHNEAKAGSKIRLYNGIYCDPQDIKRLPDFFRSNALRIANYLFGETASLAFSSAYLKGIVEAQDSTPASPKFKLFVSGSYFRSTFVTPILEIVHFNLSSNNEYKRYCHGMEDAREGSLQALKIMCAADEMVYLQNFTRRRGHLERFLSNDQMLDLRERLETKPDLPMRLMNIVKNLNGYGLELGKAMESLRQPLDEARHDAARRQGTPQNILEFNLGWQRRPVAKLIYSGVNWTFKYLPGWEMALQSQSFQPGQIPAFINNLLPEGPMRDMLRSRDEGSSNTLLEKSERFMSNLSLVQDVTRLKKIPVDVLEGKLKDFSDASGVFNGSIIGLPGFSKKIIHDLHETLVSKDMLRVAGMQPKIMMNLSFDGELTPAIAQPATHILKFPGVERNGQSIKGVIEWASMTLARGSGLPCAEFAMVRLKGDHGEKDVLGYLTERFDIPKSDDDMRMIFAEDICSVMGLPAEAKGMPNLNDVIENIKRVSTSVKEDMEDLYRQIAVNYLLENADFHTKNASVLKIANPMLNGFRSARMSPIYDVLYTRPFSSLSLKKNEREPMQLGFEFDDQFIDREWTQKDFVNLGSLCGLTPERSDQLLRDVAVNISRTAAMTLQNLPEILKKEEFSAQREYAVEVFERAMEHCHLFFNDLPNTLSEQKRNRSTSASRLTCH